MAMSRHLRILTAAFIPRPTRLISVVPARTIHFRMSSTTPSAASAASPPLPQQSSRSQSSDAAASHTHETQDGHDEHDQHKPLLTLPAPGDVVNDSDASRPAHQLEVNGQDMKLDSLGPVVVNENGTISRIDNWHEMADIEKANVRRILLKRNAQRLARLRAAQSNDQDAA